MQVAEWRIGTLLRAIIHENEDEMIQVPMDGIQSVEGSNTYTQQVLAERVRVGEEEENEGDIKRDITAEEDDAVKFVGGNSNRNSNSNSVTCSCTIGKQNLIKIYGGASDRGSAAKLRKHAAVNKYNSRKSRLHRKRLWSQ